MARHPGYAYAAPMPDDIFAEPRLVQVYDAVEGEREDLGHYLAIAADGRVLTSESTRRFRSRAGIEQSLQAAGYTLRDVREAPDRPGREMVFIART